MNKENKSARSNRVNSLKSERLTLKHSPFFKEINRVVIRNLDFEIVLQNKQNSFYALVTPSKKTKKTKKERKNIQQLPCTSHERTINDSKETRQIIEKKIFVVVYGNYWL